jgi:prepilin-type N-terminal cleavage/methylation domain-containing protein
MKSSIITKKYFEDDRLLTGFTLIEVMVTMAIFVLLVFGVSVMLSSIFTNQNQQSMSMSSIDHARAVDSAFTNEIRNALTGSDGSYPLNQAGDSQIIFYSNYGANNGIVSRIRYYVSNNILYKGIVAPTGSPLTYNLSSESVKPVLTGMSSASSPIFYYYDGNYNGSTPPLAQPINVNKVRFVKINLSVLNQITPNDTSAFLITAGAEIRSIKDNLGN